MDEPRIDFDSPGGPTMEVIDPFFYTTGSNPAPATQ